MLLIQIIWKIFLAHRERKAEKHMEKNKTVWMFLTALVISLVIVGGSMTLSVRHQKAPYRVSQHRSRPQIPAI